MVDVYVLVYIHIGSRRVFATSSTAHPDKAWVGSTSPQLHQHIAEYGKKASHLILDLDAKFIKEFETVLESDGIEMVRVGPKMPNLNSYAERWVQSIRRECLDHFIAFGEKHLDHLVTEFVDFYNECRPHQGVGNVTLPSLDDEPPETLPFPGVDSRHEAGELPPDVIPFPSKLACKERLGGKLRHYYRQAA